MTSLKQRGIVPSVKPILDEMLVAGFYPNEGRYQAILRRAGEEAFHNRREGSRTS